MILIIRALGLEVYGWGWYWLYQIDWSARNPRREARQTRLQVGQVRLVAPGGAD